MKSYRKPAFLLERCRKSGGIGTTRTALTRVETDGLNDTICSLTPAIRSLLEKSVSGLSGGIDYWKNRAGLKGVALDLQVERVTKISDDEYEVVVQGKTWTKRETTEKFRIRWMPKTALAHFMVFRWERLPYFGGKEFVFVGMCRQWNVGLAGLIAIYTYGSQIPEVMTHPIVHGLTHLKPEGETSASAA